jgi:hypothetical protein
VPAVVFLLFLTMPILAAFFLDTDTFVQFLILFCLVGGLCTSDSDPLTRSRRQGAPRNLTRCNTPGSDRGSMVR